MTREAASQSSWPIAVKTKTSKEKVTVSDLLENMSYTFKIKPEYEGGVGTESDISEYIKTKRELTFDKAYQKLWEARKKWYNIGLCLEIDRTNLDIIKMDNQQSTDCCFKEMLIKWFDQVSGTCMGDAN